MAVITPDQARRFYDRIGTFQDRQAFYEDPPLDVLVSHGRFDRARAVCEIGCGTGRLAERLLVRCLPPGATYLGLDVSATMVKLATARLKRWRERARVIQTDGTPRIAAASATLDRVVTTYVLDLLSPADIQALVAEARRVLTRDGLFCSVSLARGSTPLTKMISQTWLTIHRRCPLLLGGCRPLEVSPYLDSRRWGIAHRSVVSAFGICSEVIVAARRGPSETGARSSDARTVGVDRSAGDGRTTRPGVPRWDPPTPRAGPAGRQPGPRRPRAGL